MKFRFIALLLALLLLPSFALAEQPTLERTEEMLRMSGAERIFRQVTGMTLDSSIDIIAQSNPNIPPRFIELFREEFTTQLNDKADEFITATAQLYQTRLSAQEVEFFLKVYASPEWKHMQEILPSIMQESQKMGAAMGQSIGQNAVAKAQERFLAETQDQQ